MALGTPLGEVREMLKAEIGASLVTGEADDARFNQLIESKQRWFEQYSWASLDDDWKVTATANTRYIAIPTVDEAGQTHNINFDRPVHVFVFYSAKWKDVAYGIDEEDYNYINSDLNQRLTPIMRWKFKAADRTQMEVWPVGTIDQQIWFRGARQLNSLRTGGVFDDDATLDLDDLLIVLTLAAEELLRRGHPDAQAKNALARERFATLRATDETRPTTIKLGGGYPPREVKVLPMKIVTIAP